MLQNLGLPELLLILIAGLVVFGPQKLPELGRSLGTAIREFRKATRELTEEVARAAMEEAARTRPAPAPRDAEPKAPGHPPGERAHRS